MKFELSKDIKVSDFNDAQKKFLKTLAQKIAGTPQDADGEWFHKAIYNLGQELGMEPKAMFQTLYQALIGKDSGPRAGWFLSILPRDWLIKRLNLES
jgi:lysyl-tRNA synthetase class 1